MKFIVAFLLCLVVHSCLSEKVRYDGYKLYKFTPRTAEAVQALVELEQGDFSEYNFWSSVGPVGIPVQIMVPPYKISEVHHLAERVGIDAEVMMENVQDYIDAEERPATYDTGFGWERYHTLSEINEWLVNLRDTYPEVVTLIEVNATYEGRTILGVKVQYPTSNVSQSVFVESTIHAREWITSATTTYILNELLTSTNTTISELARKHVWYFFPVFNPDGFQFSHTTDRMWRKTRVPHSVLCIGADPNRNWDYHWGAAGTSNSPCTEIYRGPEPFSEPSCRVMSEYIDGIADQLLAYISFHSFSQLLLIPFGYTHEHIGNYDKIYQIGLKSAEALAQRFGTQYRVELFTKLYIQLLEAVLIGLKANMERQ
uniref:Zinc carboxypeptidase A 1 n=1 Tax=Anoplophora glabripennis TaxID=217634 RepID=V5GJF2_ANOGL